MHCDLLGAEPRVGSKIYGGHDRVERENLSRFDLDSIQNAELRDKQCKLCGLSPTSFRCPHSTLNKFHPAFHTLQMKGLEGAIAAEGLVQDESSAVYWS